MGNVVNGVSQTVHLSNSNKLSSRCEIMIDSNDGILEKKGHDTPEYISQWGENKC